jgi:hypothetical protein
MSGFDKSSRRQIADTVRARKGQPVTRPKHPNAPRIIQPIYWAKVTTILTARSGTTKGHGVVTTYADDQTGTGNDVIVSTGVKVWNGFTSSVAVGKWVQIGTINGLLQLLNSDC